MNDDFRETDHPSELPTAADRARAAMRFLRVLWFRRLYVVACLVVVGCLGALYYMTATRTYEARASLLITQTGSDVWNPASSTTGSRPSLIPTYQRLVTKEVVLAAAANRIKRLPAELRVDFVGVPSEKWSSRLRGKITVANDRRSNLLELTYSSQHPEAAAAVLDAVVASFLEFVEQDHRDDSAVLVGILDRERVDLEGQLRVKQSEMLTARRHVKDLGLGTESTVAHPLVQRVVKLNENLVEVQQERLQYQATLSALQQAMRHQGDLRQHLMRIEPMVGREMVLAALGLNAGSSDMVNEVERKLLNDRARLTTLQAHLGPAHPTIVELTESIRSAERFLGGQRQSLQERMAGMHRDQLGRLLLGMMEQRLAGALAHERELTREYEQVEAQAVKLNDRLAELELAQSELQRLRRLHETLLDRITSIDINQNRSTIQARAVSPAAASEKPVWPRLSYVLAACLAVGFSGAAGVVYVLDLLDDRFRSPDELEQQLGLSVLAMVRQLPDHGEFGVAGLQTHVASESVESEAFRTLRTALALSQDETDRLAVTSTEPGDGKTTVLANLGVSLAHSGKRTLLIDADLRRPGLTRMFQMNQEYGVTDLLRDDGPIAQGASTHVRTSGIQNLSILPSGPRPSDPAEMLSRGRLADLLAWAGREYDHVLIDCPPVMVASDAAIAGRLADGVLLVVQPEKNNRRLVVRAVEMLAAMRVRVLGVVANRVGEEGDHAYYGYDAAYGYGGDAEDDVFDASNRREPPVESTLG